jgi:hypothetical protein
MTDQPGPVVVGVAALLVWLSARDSDRSAKLKQSAAAVSRNVTGLAIIAVTIEPFIFVEVKMACWIRLLVSGSYRIRLGNGKTKTDATGHLRAKS